MAALTFFNLVKGLDVEEAAVTAARRPCLGESLVLLRPSRAATLRSAVWRLPLLLAGVFLVSLAAVAFAAPATPPPRSRPRDGNLLLWQRAPFTFHDELARTGLASS